MKVDAALTNRFDPGDLKVQVSNSITAVIDVIRATSSIAALFGRGAESIIIAATLDQAYSLKERYPDRLLCGEEKGHPPEGFDHGNSPLEFSRLDLEGRRAILKTTNGTASFLKAAGSPAVYSLAALNMGASLKRITEAAKELKKDILFICSGELGKLAYDDAYIAGMAIRDIIKISGDPELSDTARLLLSAAMGGSDIEDALEKSTSARSLRSVGLVDDIGFCARIDEYRLAVKAVIRDGMPQLVLD